MEMEGPQNFHRAWSGRAGPGVSRLSQASTRSPDNVGLSGLVGRIYRVQPFTRILIGSSNLTCASPLWCYLSFGMNYKISRSAASLSPSLTLAIDSKAKQMK